METPQPKPSRLDLSQFKSHFIRTLGAPKTKQYFQYLELFLRTRLTKTKFARLAVTTVGKDNIVLHNRLIGSILSNARIGSKTKDVNNTLNGSGSENLKETEVDNTLNGSGSENPKETEVNGSGSENPKETEDDNAYNGSGSDPKGKGLIGSGLDPIENEILKEKMLNGSGSDPNTKPGNSGKTPSGHFGEALNSPPVKNGNNDNGKNAALGKLVEEGEEVEQNAKITRTQAQKGMQSGIDLVNELLGVGMQDGNVSNDGVPAGGNAINVINDIKGTEPQNARDQSGFNQTEDDDDDDDDDVVITGVKTGGKPNNNIAGIGSQIGLNLNPFVSGPQTGFNAINYPINYGLLSTINENNNLLRTGYNPVYYGSGSGSRRGIGSSSGTGVQGRLNAISDFSRTGGFNQTNFASVAGNSPQIRNPLNELSRAGLQTNYASSSGSGVQGGLNQIFDIQGGFNPSIYASVSGTQATNPISDDLSRAAAQFCNLQRTGPQIAAPIGLPSVPSRKRPRSYLDSESCYNRRELPDTNSLFNRLNKRLRKQGMSLTVEAAEAINQGLNEQLMRVIRPAVELVRARNGNSDPNPNPNPNPNLMVEVIDLTDEGDEGEAGPSTSNQSLNPKFANPKLRNNPNFASANPNLVMGSRGRNGQGPSTCGASNPNPNFARNPNNDTINLGAEGAGNERNPNLITTIDINVAIQLQQNQRPNSRKEFKNWFDSL